MNKDQAIAAAIADGFDPADITAQVLAMYGFVAPDPLANVIIAPPVASAAEIAAAIASAQDEAKSNSLPNQIIQGVEQVAAVVAPVVKSL